MEKDFLKTIIQATGLPENLIFNEIHRLAQERGLQMENLSLEDLRSLLKYYLRNELVKAKKAYS